MRIISSQIRTIVTVDGDESYNSTDKEIKRIILDNDYRSGFIIEFSTDKRPRFIPMGRVKWFDFIVNSRTASREDLPRD